MSRTRDSRKAAGFTLVEAIVAVAIVGSLLAIAAPVALKAINTAKMKTAAFDCNALLRRAKAEAIKKNSPVVVRYDSSVDPDPSDTALQGRLVAFVDVHGPDPDEDPKVPDGVWNPATDGRPYTSTDHELQGCSLPQTGVSWGAPKAPIDGPCTGLEVGALCGQLGFTTIADETVAIMDPDGTIRDIGAWRFGDTRGNYLEVEIAPAATARVKLKKWDPDNLAWREQKEDDRTWIWY